MGYNFHPNGTVHPDKDADLIVELAQFARRIEVPWSLLCARISGDVYRGHESSDECQAGPPPGAVIPRAWRKPSSDIPDALQWVFPGVCDISEELVHGITLWHPYWEWNISWNLDHAGALVAYSGIHEALRRCSAIPEQRDRPCDKRQVEDLLMTPFPLRGQFHELDVDIHVPWRRSDVEFAVDALRLIEKHCSNFSVHDDYGVWKNGMSAWKNLLDGYVKLFDGTKVHSDIDDLHLGVPDGQPDTP